MKTDKRTQLLKILSDASQSISSAALANMLGTSERTVRNYIKAINEEGKAVITSSREGYRLESHTASLDTLPNEAESRVWKVLSDLLTSKEGVNAFDEAEALYVSSSTILNTVIPQVKEIAKEYDLRIESQKYQFYLRGSEQNRRKMIGSLAVRNTYGFFNSKDALEQLFPSQDIDGIMQELFTTCQESKLFLNDFALNNLLIHILVILIRLNIGNELDDKEPPISVDELLASSQDREDIVNLADMISANFEQKYSIRIPERDYKQILMLIALSVEHETVDIQCVISPEFIHNVASILSMMSQRYCTPEFDNDYILQFSLHMYYAQQRCAFHISYPNPIALQFKKDYAPVYDMAVYFAHRFAQIYHIEVSEDEIAFIAFHIGSYLENNKQSREHATCVVIVESYHMLARQLIHEINVAFANQIIVKEVLPLNRYLNRQPECDLVLTTLPLGIQHPHVVQISPILTKANCESIRAQLSSISTERELARAHQFLQSLLLFAGGDRVRDAVVRVVDVLTPLVVRLVAGTDLAGKAEAVQAHHAARGDHQRQRGGQLAAFLNGAGVHQRIVLALGKGDELRDDRGQLALHTVVHMPFRLFLRLDLKPQRAALFFAVQRGHQGLRKAFGAVARSHHGQDQQKDQGQNDHNKNIPCVQNSTLLITSM